MTPSNFESSTDPAVQVFLTDDTRNLTTGIRGWELVSTDPIWQNLNFSFQLPHGYKEGTSIIPIIHGYYPGAEEDILLFEFEHNFGVYGYTTFNYEITSNDSTNNVNIVRPALVNTDGRIGQVVDCRFSRIVKDDEWTYPDLPGSGTVNNDSSSSFFLRGISFQYQKNTCGSNNQSTKVIGQARTNLLD